VSTTALSTISIKNCGVVQYLDALEMQRDFHEKISNNRTENTILLLQHPSVFTAGKRTLEEERPLDGTEVIDVDRGGKITWHGLGQIVGYPIMRLAKPTELVGFVRELESVLIDTCSEFGLQVQRIKGRSGVWMIDEINPRKIAAIGIRVAKGTTMHGFALNVNPSLEAFSQIIPCGIADADVTSMAKELQRDISPEEVLPILERNLLAKLVKVSV
jgi:lipoyl(octanoyl) transferase